MKNMIITVIKDNEDIDFIYGYIIHNKEVTETMLENAIDNKIKEIAKEDDVDEMDIIGNYGIDEIVKNTMIETNLGTYIEDLNSIIRH